MTIDAMPEPHEELAGASMTDLRRRLDSGELTVRRLAEMHVERIAALDRAGPELHAVIELNPEWEEIADHLDAELRAGHASGPLHGMPVLVKDNIDTGDRMLTTAGSLALASAPPAPRDAPAVAGLRAAGMLILGKANLSEWANFRSTRSSSGWSGRGRQCRNPHVVDRTPCGSSSGSAVSVAAGFAPVAVGTETDGSIICPSSINGVVGIKPGLGVVSQDGIIPISHSQDNAGPHARYVRDAALLLGAMSTARADFTSQLKPDALRGRRLGVLREPYVGYSEHSDRVYETALRALRDLGAELIDPVVIPSTDQMRKERDLEWLVMQYEFKAGVAKYLATRPGAEVQTLADLIRFNENHASEEMPYFRQETFEKAESRGGLDDPEYIEARDKIRRWARDEGIDAALGEHSLDALVAPGQAPAWVIDQVDGDRGLGGCTQPSAIAGYPIVTVPAGLVLDALPVGLALFSGPGNEALLLGMAYAFEQYTQARRSPRYLPTLKLP